MIRTRAKMQVVASGRARRENVPRYIFLFNGGQPESSKKRTGRILETGE